MFLWQNNVSFRAHANGTRAIRLLFELKENIHMLEFRCILKGSLLAGKIRHIDTLVLSHSYRASHPYGELFFHAVQKNLLLSIACSICNSSCRAPLRTRTDYCFACNWYYTSNNSTPRHRKKRICLRPDRRKHLFHKKALSLLRKKLYPHCL